MDFGLELRGKRLLGSHKTIRGLVTGVLCAALLHYLQTRLAIRWSWAEDLAIDPVYYQYWWIGAWLGFLALVGDALKSLVKRQLHIAPGKPWLPWDKIDWIIGTLAGSWFIFHFEMRFAITAILCGLLLSFAGKIVGYWLNINSSWI